MINEVFFEYKVLIVVLCVGIVSGLLWDIKNFVLYVFKNNKIAKNILDFVFSLLCGVVFFLSLNYFNFGAFRLYLFVAFLFALFFEQKLFGKLIAKWLIMFYTYLNKMVFKFKTSKTGKVLFK